MNENLTNDTVMSGWVQDTFTAGGITHTTYKRGSGPGVVVIHEIPGITPTVARFANDVVNAGFTVVMPLLVGQAGREPSGRYMAASLSKVCISREFTTMAMGRTSPVIAWLRAVAKHLHHQVGGVGVGAIGMCFSGGFALGMMVDDILVAPVLSQPSLPFAFGKSRGANLGLSADDELVVAQRARDGCQVLGLQFDRDKLVGTRFESLRALLGDAFIAIEYPSSAKTDHSVLTEQRQEDGVAKVIEFLRQKLQRV
ncbi:MAG: dienelactone hydrolase family protein [Ilumatobacteraceae bacterium]